MSDLAAYQTFRSDGRKHLVFEGDEPGAWLSSTASVDLQEVL